MNTFQKIFALFFLSLWVLTACKDTAPVSDQKPLINPPIAGWDKAFHHHQFEASEGTLFKLPSGTTICIPASCLQDDQGTLIAGKVLLRYREFHDATDIFLSGIPMNYDSAGSHQLTSAGMFELEVSQGKVPLALAAGSQIEIKMASRIGGDNYNFYYLDRKARNWSFQGQRDAEINKKKALAIKRIKQKKLRQSFPLDKRHFCFNYEALLDIYVNNDWTKIKAAHKDSLLKTRILSKAEAYGVKCLDFSLYSRIDFRGNSYPATMLVWKKLRSTDFPDWLSRHERAKVEDLGNGSFRLEFYTSGQDSLYFETIAQPVMALKSLLAFSPDYWTTQYASAMKQIAEEEIRLSQEAEVFRSFELQRLGIYNWDRLRKEESAILVQADFAFGKTFNSSLSSPMVYYLPGDNRSVVKFPSSDWKNFNLVEDPRACMISILPDHQMAFYGPDDFAAIDRNSLREMQSPTYLFQMRKQKLRSVTDLRNLIQAASL